MTIIQLFYTNCRPVFRVYTADSGVAAACNQFLAALPHLLNHANMNLLFEGVRVKIGKLRKLLQNKREH